MSLKRDLKRASPKIKAAISPNMTVPTVKSPMMRLRPKRRDRGFIQDDELRLKENALKDGDDVKESLVVEFGSTITSPSFPRTMGSFTSSRVPSSVRISMG